jgi:signal transduction histidine kinase
MRLTRSFGVDTALAVALAVLTTLATAGADLRTDADVPIDVLGYAMVAVAALSLAVRRQWSLLCLAVTALSASAYLVVGYPYGPILVSFMIAVYSVARHRPLATSAPASAAALAVLLLHLLTNDAALPGFLGLIPGSAWVVVPFAVGTTVRVVRESSERARAELLREGVREERLRVAQEVHDVVGHGLAAINMQANVALHVLDRDPAQAETALTAISRSSAEALEELRATLGVLRSAGPDEDRAPTPGLDRIEDLCRRMRAAGLRVELRTGGSRRAVPPAVALAGYRVVQESLTNVLRHGGTRMASVAVEYAEDAVALVVSNPAHGSRAGREGLGIPGMRRRVEALGGEFSAGPTGDGRFQVRAVLPTGAAA